MCENDSERNCNENTKLPVARKNAKYCKVLACDVSKEKAQRVFGIECDRSYVFGLIKHAEYVLADGAKRRTLRITVR